MAGAILSAHVAIIVFNLFGLIAVPLGAFCGWRFVRVRWWRVLHLLLLAAVAGQAAAGRACLLTLWQAVFTGPDADQSPLIARWINQLIYWPLPIWVFALLYAGVFGYALVLFWLVPVRRSARASRSLRRRGAYSRLRSAGESRCCGIDGSS